MADINRQVAQNGILCGEISTGGKVLASKTPEEGWMKTM
jgi:hypothetical protein